MIKRYFQLENIYTIKKNNNIKITELPHGVFSEYIIKGNKRREKENKFSAKSEKYFEKITKISKAAKTKKIPKEIGHEYDNIFIDIDDEMQADSTVMPVVPVDTSTVLSTVPLTGTAVRGTDEVCESKMEINYTITNKSVVQNIIDRSDDKEVSIEISLIKGGYKMINENSCSEWDPIIEYFYLRRIIYDNLCFLNKNNEVIKYKNYENIFKEWFKERKKLYIKRVDRRIIIIKLQI